MLQSPEKGAWTNPIVFLSQELAPAYPLGSLPQAGLSWALVPALSLTKDICGSWALSAQGLALGVSNGIVVGGGGRETRRRWPGPLGSMQDLQPLPSCLPLDLA